MAKMKWTEESIDTLEGMVSNDGEVSVDEVEAAADALGTSARSVAAKLRHLGYEVESMARSRVSPFSDEQEDELREFLGSNEGKFTYAEIASTLFGGAFTSKQIQGKVLSMELTEAVKPTEKVETPKVYTDEEEATFIKMVKSGAYLEEISEALGKPIASIRGKALSLNSKEGLPIPAQRDRKPAKADPFETLGDVSGLTVEEIAEKLDKSVRGVKTMLTHRGLTAANYDGAKKKAKAEERKAASA
jgi:transposase